MPKGRNQIQRWKWAVALCATVFLLVILALPLWLPLLLRAISAELGGSFRKYEALGYRGFVLHGFALTNRTVIVTANRVELSGPFVLLADRLRQPQDRNAYARVQDWQVIVDPARAKQPTVHREKSVYTNFVRVANILAHVQKWLPTASLTNGHLLLAGEPFLVPSARLQNRRIQAELARTNWPYEATVSVKLAGAPAYKLSVDADRARISLVSAATIVGSGLDLTNNIFWESNQFSLTAHFGKQRLLPETAQLDAPALTISPRLFGLTNNANITGKVSGSWTNGQFAVTAKAASEASKEPELPALTADMELVGDTNHAVLRRAQILSPGVTVELTRNLELFYAAPFVRSPALLGVTAKLENFPKLRTSGLIQAVAHVQPMETDWPTVFFQARATNVHSPVLTSVSSEVDGQLSWPFLLITNASILSGNTRALITGGLDLKEKRASNGTVAVWGNLPEDLLPAGITADSLSLTGTFQGPITGLQHTASVTVIGTETKKLPKLDFNGQWTAANLNASNFTLSIHAGRSTLAATGSTLVGDGSVNIALKELRLAGSHGELLSIQKPVQLQFQKGTESNRTSFTLSPLKARGPSAELQAQGSVEWPVTGYFALAGTNLHSELFRDFYPAEVPDVRIDKISTEGGWTNGPLVFSTDMLGRFRSNQLSAAVALRGGSDGIAISKLILQTSNSVLATASGALPISLVPGSKDQLRFDLEAPLHLSAVTQPDTELMRDLTTAMNAELVHPRLKLELRGTGRKPNGSLELHIDRVVPTPARTNAPEISEIGANLVVTEAEARLTQGRFLVQKQPVNVSAAVPLGEEYWRNLLERPLPDLTNATGSFKADRARIAAFAELFPTLLSPQGEVSADIRLEKGMKFGGQVQVTGARTRTLPEIGPVRDINATVKLAEGKAQLTEALVNIGGAEVRVNGFADLAHLTWTNLQPPFLLTVTGTNVPLSRRPESVIRSDLDLRVIQTNGAPPVVEGSVRLRDSFFLSNLADLVPGHVKSPQRRPPYFSVETEPLANWRLAVQVTGPQFLRIRSAVFNGQISTTLKLQGTLQEPVALGDVTIDSGRVRFPFASLQVQTGIVSLTSQNPYEPQLAVNASSRQFGYDLKMEVTGPASKPVIQFSSTPPLTPEEILLMVTAGEMPTGSHSFTPEKRVQTLAMFLGRDLLARLGVGDASEPKLTVRSGEDISESGRPTYYIEYKLSDRWSLVGEYDRFGDFNVGTKWRIYSK